LALEWGEALRRCEVLAAAGVRARLPALVCAGCGKKPILRSRSDLQSYVLGSAPSRCLRCDGAAAYAVDVELEPSAQQRRERLKQRGLARAAERHARERWEAQQRAQIEAAYPLRLDPGGAADRPAASLRAEMAALLLLAVAAGSGRSTLSAAHPSFRPLAPSAEFMISLLADCAGEDVLRIHPGSPVRAWGWRQSFEQAWAAASDPASVGEPERGVVDLLLVHWYAPFGDGGSEAAGALNGHLVAGLQPDQLRGSRRRELLDFCVELIQHEAIRDFEVRLEQASLPRLSAAQRQRLTDVMGTLGGYLTLAQCSTLASRAIRGGGDGISARRRESHPRWASFAIAWLIEVVEHPLAYDLDGVPPAPDDDSTSWATQMIFSSVCGLDPWHASVAAVAAVFREPQDQQQDLVDVELDMTEAVRLLLDRELRTDPHAAYQALEQQYKETSGSTRAVIGRLIELVDLYRGAGGTLRQALAAAMSATLVVPGSLGGKAGPHTVAGRVVGVMYNAALDSMLGAPPWRGLSEPSAADHDGAEDNRHAT
jgi:hypothetical protein